MQIVYSENDPSKGTSLVVQWLRLLTPMQGARVPLPGRGTKIPHATRRRQKRKKERKEGKKEGRKEERKKGRK